ncbi:hypothetical protein [Chondromyces crocatus]|uniref:Uncharacterized protein n=1 Tax=Chondromyces crocatus TaxID=52 RepID=A0A0K1ERV4_CHOCO|nr:hypothetical protein [Chondromyces crocatus]AKT43576.1 uncharacterized protein CMC5_078090 [Chondromyces crocatus]
MVLMSGKSKCRICGELLGSEAKAGLQHFVRNKKDPLFLISGVPLHRRCLYEWPLREKAFARFEERKQRIRDKICVVCGERITHDWYTTDFLTDDPSHPLYEFNYLHFHRSHLIQWAHFSRFKKLVEEFITSGEYEGMPILPDDLGT